MRATAIRPAQPNSPSAASDAATRPRKLGSGSLSITGDQNLGFAVENSLYRKRARAYKGVRKFEQQLRRYKVKELLDMDLRSKYTGFEYSVPTTTHIGLPSQDLPVPPFIFGFWFFNRKI